MKKRMITLLVCTVMLLCAAAMAAFADEPVFLGVAYDESKAVFTYQNANATQVSLKLYATLNDTDEGAAELGTYPMTAGENGVWTVSVESDLQNVYYTYVYTAGAEPVEIPDPNNAVEGAARSHIKKVEKYDLWVSGVQVTSTNAQDVLGAADENASVLYDAESNTLTLAAGATITAEGPVIKYSGGGVLTLRLLGNAALAGKIGAIEVSCDGGNEIAITAEGAAVLYASAAEAGNGVTIGPGSKLTVGGKVILQATGVGDGKAGLALGENASMVIEDGGKVTAQGTAADVALADSAAPIPLEYLAGGKLELAGRKLTGFATVGSDGVKYTCAGAVSDGAGIVITETAESHVYWLTDSASGFGHGWAALTVDGETRTLTLCDVKLNNAAGAGISAPGLNILVRLQGASAVTGSTVGMEAGGVTVEGVHGMLSANGISAANGLIIKEGIVEITGSSPIFGEKAPDLSQYSGEFAAVAGADKDTATEYNAENAASYLYFKLAPVNGHALGEWNAEVAATCQGGGTRGYHQCTVCQKRVDAQGVEIVCPVIPANPDGHNYNQFVTEKKGTHTKTCAYDAAHVVTEDCSGGTATCMHPAKCDLCGEFYGRELYHDYSGDFTHKDALGHWKLCLRPECGRPDDAKAHTGGVASCTEPYYCAICGHAYGEPAGHSYTTKASAQLVTPATCSSPAMYLAQCDCCDSIHESMTVPSGDPLPHTFGTEWSAGQEGHWHICECGAHSEAEKHVEKIVNQKKATEQESGYTGDIYCEVCGYEVVKGIAVPATGGAQTETNWVVIACAVALVVSGLGLAGVIVFGIKNKKKVAQ